MGKRKGSQPKVAGLGKASPARTTTPKVKMFRGGDCGWTGEVDGTKTITAKGLLVIEGY